MRIRCASADASAWPTLISIHTQNNLSKIKEQLDNLRLEFKELKANLSVVANVTEDVNQLKQDVELLKEEISDIEDKISG